MTSDLSSKDQLPEDPQQLIELYYEKNRPEEFRNECMRKLLPIIKQIALVTAMRLGLPKNDDLVECAVSHVCLGIVEGKYHLKKGRFVAWCRQVCRNYILDELRSGKGEILESDLGGLMCTQPPDDENGRDQVRPFDLLSGKASKTDQPDIFRFEFLEEDLQRVRTWQPLRDRLIVLVCSGLWVCVPRSEWQTWVQQAGLAQPFPPPNLINLDDPKERMQEVTRIFGITRNHLSVIWRRRREWLLRLSRIQELIGDLVA
ncbi:MAG: hypothetical protein RMI91_12355 [Gemmatales bacterium]|nr:hypothetical protein [Gemmatales bacterium]MDW7995433.1 hypothetical protein [Gemmatales bacterium]